MILNKNIDLNNIFVDYSLSAITNSYVLSYYSNLQEKYYKKIPEQPSQQVNIEIYDEETGLKYKNIETTQFNKKESYYSNDDMITNNMIIANVADETTAYDGSYIIYYNTPDGLRQLSYHYKEGNGIYYDSKNHIINMNIDNYTIKEINRKLYFDTNSIPISSADNYGISYVNNEFLEVNNGILTVKEDYIENLISYKYKIKNLYNSLSSLQSSFAYYNNVYIKKNDTTNIFTKFFNNVLKYDHGNMIDRNISYEVSTSLYFPKSEIKYIDNYYFANNLIDPKYKQFITLDDNNSYIIYCKDLEQLVIYSYLENQYKNCITQFNDNILNNIENNITKDNNSLEIISHNDLYSYIFIDELNEYNQIIIKDNIVNKDVITENNTNYSYTANKIQYYSRVTDEKIFKKNGIIMNSRINITDIEKCIIEYYLVNNVINYSFNLKNINIKYDNKNIKILYDDRDISYCVCNNIPIDYDSDKYYFFIALETDEKSSSNIYSASEINLIHVDANLRNVLINSKACFTNDSLNYLFYGYNWNYNHATHKYNKKYYSIWHDLPTSYITPSFMQSLILINNRSISSIDHKYDISNNLVLFNFDELYTENFNEVDFEFDDEGKNPNSHTLYLCELYNNQINLCHAENGQNITIDI